MLSAMRRLLTLLVALALGATVLVAPRAGADGPRAAAAPGTLKVVGKVERRLRLSVASLRALPQQTVEVSFQSGEGQQTHTYTGPKLLDVVGLAVPRFDPAVKNDSLRFWIAATGSDGYRAIVSWGEVDPGFGATNALLAVSEDGRPLDDAGPRLVVPGDVRGGRYVTGVVEVRLGRAGG